MLRLFFEQRLRGRYEITIAVNSLRGAAIFEQQPMAGMGLVFFCGIAPLLNQTKEYETMECERLQRLVKSWYAQVQEESMAPARMASFMEKHIAECAFCLADPLVRQDIEKITAIILPPSKIRKPSAEDGDELAAVPEEESDTSADEELPGDDDAGTEDEDSDDETEALEDDELEEDDLEDDD